MNFTFDTEKARIAQEDYCNKNYVPHFAPQSGVCWSCGHNIYSEGGYSVEVAGEKLITRCPFCGKGYCE